MAGASLCDIRRYGPGQCVHVSVDRSTDRRVQLFRHDARHRSAAAQQRCRWRPLPAAARPAASPRGLGGRTGTGRRGHWNGAGTERKGLFTAHEVK